MTDTDKEIAGHEYDGIKELDNSLPGWWLNGFYLTILFAVAYFGYYQWGPGLSLRDTLRKENESIELARLSQDDQKKKPDRNELLAIMAKPERLKEGHDVFSLRCMPCHGDKGQGGIGPNLTDDYWLHGGKVEQIALTIMSGVPDKGMPPWGPVLSEDQVKSVAAFVKSIRGTNPPGAKAPQGVLENE